MFGMFEGSALTPTNPRPYPYPYPYPYPSTPTPTPQLLPLSLPLPLTRSTLMGTADVELKECMYAQETTLSARLSTQGVVYLQVRWEVQEEYVAEVSEPSQRRGEGDVLDEIFGGGGQTEHHEYSYDRKAKRPSPQRPTGLPKP